MTNPGTDYDKQDCELLEMLASVHMKFGMHATALSFLELCDWIDKNRDTTLRLMARAYQKLDKPAELLGVMERLQGQYGRDALSSSEMDLIWRAHVQLGQLEDAAAVGASPSET